jgi:predicted RNA binding protein YcfA (HicA-like mRNA interferase family)
MSRTPRVTGPELIAALAKAGFCVLRVKGSHHFLRHQDGRSTVVPAHSGETT